MTTAPTVAAPAFAPTADTARPPLTFGRIARTWWPLAASWLFMSAELPALVAVIARLPDPEINLAAYGGVVFPLALIIESPVIMLLAASTALSRDAASYATLRRTMMRMGAALTALHLLVALTPLYDVVVRGIIGAPAPIVEPARLGLVLMTPWTWSIAYRRFNQGALIRFGRSRAVGIGTAIRLTTVCSVLLAGYAAGWPGIVVGTVAVAAGVMAEALYARRAVRPVLRGPLRDRGAGAAAITTRSFAVFYVPLVLTSFLTLVAQPIGSAAMSRLPNPIASLAVWPAIGGLIFILRSPGIAYNEVVVALLDEPDATRKLRRFALMVIAAMTLAALAVAATPLAELWLRRLQALSPELLALALGGMWLIVPLAGLSVLQSWYQGAILHGRRTHGITEAVVIYLAVSGALLFAAVRASHAPAYAGWIAGVPGVYIVLVSMAVAMAAQTAWLWWRARPALAGAVVTD